MAIAPWNVLARGKFRSDEEEEQRAQSGDAGRAFGGAEWRRNEKEKTMSAALDKVAKEVGAKHLTAVAIAYVMQKAPYVFPIVGGRKVEQLQANVEALKITLSPEHIKYLESVFPFDPGFPISMFVSLIRFDLANRLSTMLFSTGRWYPVQLFDAKHSLYGKATWASCDCARQFLN